MTEAVTNVIILNDVRIDRVSLTRPFIGKDAKVDPKTGKQEGKYHVDAIFKPEHPQYPAFKLLMRAAVQKKFVAYPGGWEAALEKIAGQDKLCVHRGNMTRPGKPQYKDLLYISANNDEQPTILVTENGVNIANRDTPMQFTPSHPSWPYAGCYANLQLQVFAYDHPTGGQGVSAQVLGVQFLRHGERLQSAQVSDVGAFGLTAAAADGAPPAQAADAGGSGGLI